MSSIRNIAVRRDPELDGITTEAPLTLAAERPAEPEAEISRDRQMAADLVRMVQDLNRAMDEAKRGGLIVEPSLSTVQSQFGGDGGAGHLLSLKIFRKLC